MIIESKSFDGYIYSLDKSGAVVERKATIEIYTTQTGFETPVKGAFATIDGHYQLGLSPKEHDIYNSVMWSSEPNKQLYIEKMTEILIARGDAYKKKLEGITMKLEALKKEIQIDI